MIERKRSPASWPLSKSDPRKEAAKLEQEAAFPGLDAAIRRRDAVVCWQLAAKMRLAVAASGGFAANQGQVDALRVVREILEPRFAQQRQLLAAFPRGKAALRALLAVIGGGNAAS